MNPGLSFILLLSIAVLVRLGKQPTCDNASGKTILPMTTAIADLTDDDSIIIYRLSKPSQNKK